jgi:hypothetical protein
MAGGNCRAEYGSPPASRALAEEVVFDRAKVTSTDWTSYPILDITEAPEAVDIVLINRPELPPAGAGESSIRPVARPCSISCWCHRRPSICRWLPPPRLSVSTTGQLRRCPI